MQEIIDKISSYNLFNNLLPGVIYVYFVSYLTDFNLIVDNLLWGIFVYYFVGLVVSRVGSLIIDPILMKLRFIKTKSYDDYVNALAQDTKIDLFSEMNNMYRTIVALLSVVLITIGINWLINQFSIPLFYLCIAIISGLFILFLFAYKKQTNYIKQRISVGII
jgi:hypothetical protein